MSAGFTRHDYHSCLEICCCYFIAYDGTFSSRIHRRKTSLRSLDVLDGTKVERADDRHPCMYTHVPTHRMGRITVVASNTPNKNLAAQNILSQSKVLPRNFTELYFSSGYGAICEVHPPPSSAINDAFNSSPQKPIIACESLYSIRQLTADLSINATPTHQPYDGASVEPRQNKESHAFSKQPPPRLLS